MSDLTWPSDRMARILDMTPRRMNQLVSEGVLFREERGRYNPLKNVVAYIRYLRDRKSPMAGEEDDQTVKRELTAARRDEIRQNIEVTARLRIPAEMVEETWSKCFDNIAGILKSRRDKTLDEETLGDLMVELQSVGPEIKAWQQQITAAELAAVILSEQSPKD